MHVLDTNTLIYFFKGLGSVSDNLLAKAPMDIGISSIVLYELEVGIAKSTAPEKRSEQLDSLLKNVNILSFGLQEAKQASIVRVNLESQGQLIGPYDILIAASALARNATLVTRNSDEFGRIPQLKLENWY